MLSQETLEKVEKLPKENSIMAKFLKDNKLENSEFASEIENNMPLAMSYYNEEAKSPYLFRKISSTSTVKSVYFNSSPSSSVSQESIGHEIKALMESNPEKNLYYNLMVLGDSGLGKTSFINTFMYFKFNYLKKFEDPKDLVPTTPDLVHNRAKRTEGKVEFHIDMIDTPGYGSYRSIQVWLKYILNYLHTKIIESKNSSESDGRVHCALFFVDNVLKQSDIVALKEIQKFTTIIPVIGKADTCTADEIRNYKKIISNQLLEAGIGVFRCDEPNAQRELANLLGECPPFCVISAVSRIISESHCYYGRKYQWGICDISNPFHTDFPLLSKYLIGKFYEKLRDIAEEKSEAVYKHWAKKKKRNEQIRREIVYKNKAKNMLNLTKALSCMAFGLLNLIRK